MFSDKSLATARQKNWDAAHQGSPEKLITARRVVLDIQAGIPVAEAVRRNPLAGGYVSKQFLIEAYRRLVDLGELQPDRRLLERLRMKPMRTLSGVTTVTVLTKPYPCPGECIFCPTDLRMPKSYLPDEPGAMRALQNAFDPSDQVQERLTTLNAIGHPTDKIELLILGGTWSAYRRDYQEWFVLRCFQALNDGLVDLDDGNTGGGRSAPRRISEDAPAEPADHGPLACFEAVLEEEQLENENTHHRNVGLVIETRPDHIHTEELAWLRHLGVTKVQLGAQSFDDEILALNKRGHNAAATLQATALLRAAGFKIVLHWMPNLLGATPDSDRTDFARMWLGFCPDEIKIYPNQLLENADLYQVWLSGGFRPYETRELIELIADVKPAIPRYCRVNRIIRDIPSTNVVAGNRRTSLRMDVQQELARRGQRCECIRCREVKQDIVDPTQLELTDLVYPAGGAEEHFLSWNTPQDRLAGFLRLSLPGRESPDPGMGELVGAALIREVHIYGQSLTVGEEPEGAAQHAGLGRKLIAEAEEIARAAGFARLAVISAVGTRQYYRKNGFSPCGHYMVKDLIPSLPA